MAAAEGSRLWGPADAGNCPSLHPRKRRKLPESAPPEAPETVCVCPDLAPQLAGRAPRQARTRCNRQTGPDARAIAFREPPRAAQPVDAVPPQPFLQLQEVQ
eukprot:9155859-Alexandrium_andersonii.AAC.1